jgi:hypothetical protein
MSETPEEMFERLYTCHDPDCTATHVSLPLVHEATFIEATFIEAPFIEAPFIEAEPEEQP